MASPDGAAHALLRVAEIGLVDAWTSPSVLTEVRRNLVQKLPRGLPIFEELWPKCLQVAGEADPEDVGASEPYAYAKHVHVLAAAMRIQAHWLLTFSLRHFYAPPDLVVLRPGDAVQTIRCAMSQRAENSEAE